MDLQNFTPTGDKLTGDELKYGLWFVTHRVLLRKLGILLLGFLNLLLFVYVAYSILSFYFIDRSSEVATQKLLTTPKLNYAHVTEISQALPLNVGLVDVLVNDQGNYDILAQLVNPNTSWYASRLTYHFESGDFKTEPQITYVLPEQEKYLVALNVKNTTAIGTAALVFDSVKWEKTDHFAELKDKIIKFDITEPKFTADGILEGTGTPVNHVDFTITNRSAYNFWQVDAIILLLRGGEVQYVNKLPLKNFSSGEARPISLNIIERLAPASQIQVIPDVDILNPESFRAFSGSGQGF